ncbi:MAG TPA: M23 family metallopeptidase [Mariprofundaceae bacterium]|nr:M23 family metallopeptidase [Mariprofundaceae bacterium]
MLTACYKVDLPYYSDDDTTYTIYNVQDGDTLYSIGQRLGIDYKVLARRNHIPYPYTIYVGQRLYLRRPAPPPSYMPLPQEKKPQSKHADRRKHKHKAHASHRHKKASGPSFHGNRARASHVHLRWPLKGRVLDRFGKHHHRVHDGIDIAAPEGTPVRAAAAGEVVYADSRLAGYGRLIIIRHTRDLFTAYARNQRNLVHRGEHVKAGQIIARVGNTGRRTAPFLHFEIRRGTTPVNPGAYLPKR